MAMCVMPSCFVVQLFLLAIFVDVSLAIQAQTNCSEFTLVFCCTVQLVPVVNYRKFFPPSLPLEMGLVVLLQSIKQGLLLCVSVKCVQRLPPRLLTSLPLNIAC